MSTSPTTTWRAGSTRPRPQPTIEQAEALRRLSAFARSEAGRALAWSDDGLLIGVTEADGAEAAYRYDANGDLCAIREPDGSERRFAYDAERRLTRATFPDGGAAHFRYAYNQLVEVEDRGAITRYRYDEAGRLARVLRGDAGASAFRYDDAGRVTEARTARVACGYHYDEGGRLNALSQTIDGVTIGLELRFDEAGRLAALELPGAAPIRYEWGDRLLSVCLGDTLLARFAYDDARRTSTALLGNGLADVRWADSTDGRPLALRILDGGATLLERAYRYDEVGRRVSDGVMEYGYDEGGRLASAQGEGAALPYAYDALDNRLHGHAISDDARGRLARKATPEGVFTYLYDAADNLCEVRRNGDVAARFAYDHKGRLAQAEFGARAERYLYGPADELVAVTDAAGALLRATVRTPYGPIAAITGGALRWLHPDARGTLLATSDAAGALTPQPPLDPFGMPLTDLAPTRDASPRRLYCGREWCGEAGLYRFGARWYDPTLGRFLTPDTYTAAPDDARLLDPRLPADEQAARRQRLLADWLKRPRARNRTAFCGNDPLNNSDPNGHWSFGGVLLSVLGAIWTLPNTLVGLALEITCLIGEVVRWLVWLVSAGNASWETPGFDAAASGRLNAFALVFSGGWLGSFSSLLGITFGNVFFVYKGWRDVPPFNSTSTVRPSAYNGEVELPRNEALYEHELRHTNQYGWFGPFYHLGLPVFGVYEWDVILNGYRNAWLERDARAHGGIDE